MTFLGTEMKHFKAEEWSDYVRGFLAADSAEAMRRHLDDGCGRCARRASVLHAVDRLSRADRQTEPPAYAVRAVKSMFRVERLVRSAEKPRFELNLSFDSLLAPAPAATRSLETQADRHLVYRSRNLAIDLYLSQGDGDERWRVAGQVLAGDASPMVEVPAFLLHGGRICSLNLSSRLGEFSLEGGSKTAMHLCLLIEDEHLVDIELPGRTGELATGPLASHSYPAS